jgi:hypothetical protein
MVERKNVGELDSSKQQLLIYCFFSELYAKIKNNPIEKRKLEKLYSYCLNNESTRYGVIGDKKDPTRKVEALIVGMDEHIEDEKRFEEYGQTADAVDIYRLGDIQVHLKDRGIAITRHEKFWHYINPTSSGEREGYIKQGVFYNVANDGSLSILSVERSKKYSALFGDYVIANTIWRRKYNGAGEEIKNGGEVRFASIKSPKVLYDDSYKYTTYRNGDYIVRLIWSLQNNAANFKREPEIIEALVHQIQADERIESLDDVNFEKRLNNTLAIAYSRGLMTEKETYEKADIITAQEQEKRGKKMYKKYGLAIMR